ncbi:Bax inhibitor-1/YccA family protein [Flavobacterium wongokense]|uniref:Bax inhibitor-1/YccA family protein n=1 Tax=Flavobacterium wongokense TaxID=2910674 RepID=UPI001F1FBD70|nr:Bax inhibitor-1/YccA family protein [Flavobacterium sp. WG47]MCF6131336.1 Bax inhibitor-1/YccA family protein [Flavobacterium sp. WG47]
MNSNNPFFKTKSFKKNDEVTHDAVVIDRNEAMTVSGTMNKSFLMLILLIASAAVTWTMTYNGQNPMVFTFGGAIVGFILVLIATFKPQLSGYLAPGYAIFEGLFIGGISAIFEVMYPGIVIQAVSCTFVTFIVCFALYKYEIVKVTEKFRAVVLAATLAIATYYLVSWLLTLFTSFQPVHYGNSMMSIGISVFVIVIAALNLFLDFDQIEKGVQAKMPKYMEWYGAMGLMITLVWLYIEFLRLLSKLSKK